MKRSPASGKHLAVPAKRSPASIVVAGIVSLAAYMLVQLIAPEKPLSYTAAMLEAARIMQEAVAVTGQYCQTAGIGIDEAVDPNRTGLIGPEFSGLFTTLGHLEAKRTTTEPAVATLIVHLLSRAGVAGGDTIAIGCSASFPALMVASLVAARAMKVHPVIIISLGASSYGATNERFNLLDMYQLLLKRKVIDVPPAAVSLGGENDVGEYLEPELMESLIRQIEASGIPLIRESDLRSSVAVRMGIYMGIDVGIYEGGERGERGRGRVSAFINAGGSYANLGTSPLALDVEPGLNRSLSLPAEGERGVLFAMAARGVPVIHLLHIRGLSLRYGLPWDPVPLNKPGEVRLYDIQEQEQAAFWLVAVAFFLILIVLTAFYLAAKPQPAAVMDIADRTD